MKKASCALFIVFVLAALAYGQAPQPNSYALSMFHFNIQYVVGGLEGFVPLPFPVPSWEITAEEVEDMIITESFEPVLDLYLAHPQWGFTIEFQGLLLEVLRDRHPTVLEKLRTLIENGQADAVSFHYSDQLFLAFPRQDWDMTYAFNKEIFEDANIPLSTVVFSQEGQAGTGMAAAMAAQGYKTLVWPKNLAEYQWGDFDAKPYYKFAEDLNLIMGAKGVNDPDSGFAVTWTFFDDGERLASKDWDPYFPWFFKKNQEAIDEYVAELTSLENDGWKISKVSDYIADLKSASVPKAELQPLLEGTWQPDSTDGAFRWLGGIGLWAKDERDNHERTLCAMARREVLAAETAANAAGIDAQPEIKEAWRMILQAEVTDATGINPYIGEIHYGITHAAEAIRMAREVIERAKIAKGISQALIDTKAGTMVSTAGPEPPGNKIEPVLLLALSCPLRTCSDVWSVVNDDPLIYKIDFQFSPASNFLGRQISVTFPGQEGPIVFCPALTDDAPASYNREDFIFEHFYLGLGNGMIGLGGGYFIVLDQSKTHVAAMIKPTTPDVSMSDDTAPWSEEINWTIYLISGSVDQATDLADRVNVHPALYR